MATDSAGVLLLFMPGRLIGLPRGILVNGVPDLGEVKLLVAIVKPIEHKAAQRNRKSMSLIRSCVMCSVMNWALQQHFTRNAGPH